MHKLLPLAAGAVIALAGIGFGVHNGNRADQLANAQLVSNHAIEEMQTQMQGLIDKINQQEAKAREAAAKAEAAAAEAPPVRTVPPQRVDRGRVTSRTVAKKPATDPRLLQLEKKFSEHDEKLANTQRLMENTRTELESKLSSTSDELNGSIARTGEEVAALRRRGERDYFEFDLVKSKQVQRVGPVSLGLRKSDTKRKRYDLDLIVDDNRLEKRNVNLLEPLYVTVPEKPQPLELVVNQISKDHVSGYISVPKYKRSELAVAEPNRTKLTPRTDAAPAK